MLARPGIAVPLVAILLAALLPGTATAAVDVTRDAANGTVLVVASGDVVETVTMDRGEDGALRIADASGAVTSSDGSCTAVAATGRVGCTTTSGQAVSVQLGGGADTFDGRGATGVALTVDGGAGADRLRLGSNGMAVATGADALDTLDLSHANSSVRVRWDATAARLVARCSGCETPWAVTLPATPKAVLLGTGDDDVDLRSWTVRGTTTWTTGAGRDRMIASRVHRSVFDTGLDPDVLVSWQAADTLKGGAGTDKLADLGGAGDVLDGGADIDVMTSLDGKHDTMRGGAGRDMCPSLRLQMSTCDSSGRVSGFEMNLYLPAPTQKSVLRVVGIFL